MAYFFGDIFLCEKSFFFREKKVSFVTTVTTVTTAHSLRLHDLLSDFFLRRGCAIFLLRDCIIFCVKRLRDFLCEVVFLVKKRFFGHYRFVERLREVA